MKKIQFALFVLTFAAVSLHAQNDADNNYDTYSTSESTYYPRNEIRANLLMSVIGWLTFDYEYFIENNFGVGLTGSYSMLEKEDVNLRGLLLPYGRLYFGSGLNNGFFIEGNTGLVFHNQRIPLYDSNGNYNGNSGFENKMNFGIGVGVGYKILTRNNWVGELQLGVGRAFGQADLEVYPRVGISIGKRF